MFKFDFDLEDAEDIDNLVSGNGVDNLERFKNATESELELFTEHNLNQLVCPQSIISTTPPERDHPARFSTGQDILFSTLYTTVVCS